MRYLLTILSELQFQGFINMLSLPVKKRRKKQPYLAVRSRLLARQIKKRGMLFLPEVRSYMVEQGIDASGPAFLRYQTIEFTGEMDVEFGIFTDKLYNGNGPIRAGFLPAGSYVSVTWLGSYEGLPEVDAMLMGWGQQKHMEWDMASTEAGLFFGCRIFIFHRTPRVELDPTRYETEVAIKLKNAGPAES
jgi:effector-binding domain-containing protein